MNKNLKIVYYGIFVWVIPSLITVTLSFFSGDMNIFEIISAVSIAVTAIAFSYIYLNGIKSNFIKEGVLIGITWLVISIVLDLLLIIAGITQLSIINYAMYVAPLYIIIPAITIGLGLYLNQNEIKKHNISA